jgi:hypothetical protein
MLAQEAAFEAAFAMFQEAEDYAVALDEEAAASAMLAEADVNASDVRALQAWRSECPAGLTLVHYATKRYT